MQSNFPSGENSNQINEEGFGESFADLFEESIRGKKTLEGRVVRGTVVGIHGEMAIVDVGSKSEGRVPLKDIAAGGEVNIGDFIDVYLEKLEGRNGEAVLSIEKARRESAWDLLQKNCDDGTFVDGFIFGKVKGGFAVDLNGAVAFLPGSQVDLRPIRDVRPLVNVVQPFKILKMDRVRNNIVVSRRSVLEESRAEARSDLVSRLSEGQVIDGIVKNITDYGAFVDLGGIDGLLHVTDISWKRINHPSEALKVGETVSVQIIRFNKETHRISLGMKQLGHDPWHDADKHYIVGERYSGRVVNIADYGAFIELETGVEGLIYVTELSWTKKNIHPSKVLELGREVEVVALDVDCTKRRLSLGLKQCMDNPWAKFKDDYPIGSLLEGTIRNVTEFGIFVGVNEELDGMVHLNDVAWDEDPDQAASSYQKGQKVRVKVLDVDPVRERISLGIKQLSDDPFSVALERFRKGDVATGTVTSVSDKGLEIALDQGVLGLIRKADLSRDKTQRFERFAIGESVEAKIVSIDASTRRVVLSIKELELDEQKAALSQSGSSEATSTLGALLEEAMRRREDSK